MILHIIFFLLNNRNDLTPEKFGKIPNENKKSDLFFLSSANYHDNENIKNIELFLLFDG